MRIKKDIQLILGISLVFFALAYARIFSEFDALVWIVGSALLLRKDYYPCLLFLIAGLQDAPGFSYLASYISFVLVAWLLIVKDYLATHFSQNQTLSTSKKQLIDFRKLVLFACIVSFYGLILSFFQNFLSFNLQAEGRFYGSVFFLMITMIIAGYISTKILFRNPRLISLLGFIALISIVHILLVGLNQILLGPGVYRSEGMIPSILEKKQLFNVTALSIPRINGPFLSPNALGMNILLFSIMIFISLFNKRSIAISLFFIFGLLGALLSLSKAVLGYYILCLAIMIIFQFKSTLSKIFSFTMIFIVGVSFVLSVVLNSNILQNSFRVKAEGLGTRDDVWRVVLDTLDFWDWFFGIGISAWPVLFDNKLGYTLSDPHTYILSVPGTFGIIGVLFYIFLLKTLYLKTFLKQNIPLTKILGLVLILLFFGRDIASIPSILGNTQTNYIVWVLLGMFYYHSTKRFKS